MPGRAVPVLVKIAPDLSDSDIDAAGRVLGQALLLLAQDRDQPAQRLLLLQLAQAGGVGRGDVDGDVVRQRIHLAQAVQVVERGLVVRSVLVLADVDPEQPAAPLRAPDVAHQRVHPVVVEAHAVDQRLRLRQPEQARARVARLRARGDGADLDEAEAERQQRVHVGAVLVQPGREPDRVGEGQPERAGRQRRRRRRFSYDSIRIGQGRENAKTYLRENPEVCDRLEAAIRSRTDQVAGEMMTGPDADSDM